mmetsp:Transcript_64669/g.100831  ORF Transcript_64669/g.100831 Transcript_64669/m.100831 type:complete len:80 (+) Transcript_64669:2-241(+)
MQPRGPAAIQDPSHISLDRTNRRRAHKGSLIDKAALRQHKDAYMECRQFDKQESKFQTYCSLCEGRKKTNSCILCSLSS